MNYQRNSQIAHVIPADILFLKSSVASGRHLTAYACMISARAEGTSQLSPVQTAKPQIQEIKSHLNPVNFR